MTEEQYVWAFVPSKMIGKELLSRNQLANIDPEAAAEAARKYDDRPMLRNKYLPDLDCHWGDIIFLSPYDPQKVMEAYKEAGFKPRPSRYFKIPISALEASGFQVCWLDAGKPHTRGKIGELLHAFDFREYRTPELPKEQLEEYRSAKAQDRIPLLYGRSPHICVIAKEGGINIDNCEIVDVDVMGQQEGLKR